MSNSLAIDAAQVKALAALLRETGLTEIEIADGDRRLRIACQVTVASAPVLTAAAAPAAANGSVATAPTAPAASDNAITSPMVGTVYLSASPGGSPFVKVGDSVKVGDTLLIIEAMKVMNPIKAARGGTVRQIFVSDAKPVEFGEPLLVVE